MSKDMKIAICFGLIIGVILSVCNLCFAVEEEEVTYNYVEGYTFSSDGVIVSDSSTKIGYYKIEPGYMYRFVNSSGGSRYVAFSDNIPGANVSLSGVHLVSGQTEYTFPGSVGYLYFDFNYPSQTATLYRTELEGMSNFIDNLAYSLTVNGVWDTVLACVPLIAICVLFGFGVFNIVRFIRLIIKTRGGM